jgi:peroxiredoxin Q/BCP
MANIKEGSKAPDFELENNSGEDIRLSDFKGHNVVLYFYPKDNTPGCTKEACSFQAARSKLEKMNAIVIGVSPDSAASHSKFSDRYGLKFHLLCDEDKKVLRQYGVWQRKTFLGKSYMGVVRTTVVIDAQGKIRKIFPKVSVDGHTEEVMNVLRLL